MPNEQEDVKFLKYKTKILAVNTGDQPDRLTQNITVPTFRGYQPGEVIPAGTLLRDIITKEFNSTPPAPKVTISVTGSGTTNPAAGAHDVTYGASFTITSATPASGWNLGEVTVDGSPVTLPHTISNVTADHTVRVTFTEAPIVTYTVTPQAGANGSISPSTAQTFNENDPVSITFTATPASGYQVDKWQVNGVDDQVGGDSFTFTLSAITADQTVKVLFKEIPATPTYTITGQVDGGHGSISPLSAGEFDEGSNVGAQTFTATPDSGYRVKAWYVNDVDQSITADTFVLPAITSIDKNYVVKVEFELIPVTTVYEIKGVAGANGSISPSGTVESVDEHTASTAHTFTATPATGYQVDKWYRNGTEISGETGTTYTLPVISDMVEDVTIKVDFEPVPAGNIYGQAYTQANNRTWREPTAEYIVLGTPDADTAASMAQIAAGTYNWTSKPQAKSIETFVIAKSVGRVTSIKDALDSECLGDTMAEKTVTIDGVDYWVYYNTSTVGAGNASYVIKGA